MPVRLLNVYRRHRVVNINANIIAAGLLAIAAAKIPVMLLGRLIGPENKLLITLAAGVTDVVFDVLIYYGLHWLANHWRPLRKHRADGTEIEARPFFKDATLIQFERALLSPLYYGAAMGLMWWLQHRGVEPSWAFVLGFVGGLVITRVVHTTWGLRNGRFRDEPAPRSAPRPDTPRV